MLTPQTRLDLPYENGRFVVGLEAEMAEMARAARAFRDSAEAELDVSYANHPRACFDLFRPEGAAQGLVVFIHGGYWKASAPQDWAHLAQGALARGYCVAMLGYPLAPEVRIREITSFVLAGLRMVEARVPGPLYLMGHSAGGHLAARMASESVLPDHMAARLVRVMPISPVVDLRPLLTHSMSKVLGLTEAEAVRESPVLGQWRASVDVQVVVGSEERPAFLDQAHSLVQAWDCGHHILPGRNHFDVLDGLCTPDSPIMRVLMGSD